MTVEKPNDPNEYPLTVIATDVHGEECYRTQIDWTGVPRNLEDVPSSDLGNRRPRWKSAKVFTVNGRELTSFENNDAGAPDDDENVPQSDDGTVKADGESWTETPKADWKNPDKGTQAADNEAVDKADMPAEAKDAKDSDKADEKAAKSEPKSKAKSGS
jgi:hypothetical protein